MSQTHYTRERLVAAHQHDLEREAARERLANSIERPQSRTTAPRVVLTLTEALVALAIIGVLVLVAVTLLGLGNVMGALQHLLTLVDQRFWMASAR